MTASPLTCAACRRELPRLTPGEIAGLMSGMSVGWRAVDDRRIEKAYAVPDFAVALAFANRVGDLADRAGHHPELHVAWGLLRVTLWTFKVDGLTTADFTLAADIDGALDAIVTNAVQSTARRTSAP